MHYQIISVSEILMVLKIKEKQLFIFCSTKSVIFLGCMFLNHFFEITCYFDMSTPYFDMSALLTIFKDNFNMESFFLKI